jgi:hypothetical protein
VEPLAAPETLQSYVFNPSLCPVKRLSTSFLGQRILRRLWWADQGGKDTQFRTALETNSDLILEKSLLGWILESNEKGENLHCSQRKTGTSL